MTKNDGYWVNKERDPADANYMSIAEWCAYVTRTAAELLDKGAFEELDRLRQVTHTLCKETLAIVDLYNQGLIEKGVYTQDAYEKDMKIAESTIQEPLVPE